MRLCKRNNRQECDNEKLKNSAYCFSCHKEIEETNNYVSSVSGSMEGMMAQLVEAQNTVLRENEAMLRIVNESMGRIAEMRERRTLVSQVEEMQVAEMQKHYADASLLVGTSPSGLLTSTQFKGAVEVTVTGACDLSVWTHVIDGSS